MVRFKKKILALVIFVFCAGAILFSSAADNVQASSEGGQIVDKICIPQREYVANYQGKTIEFDASAQYMFVVIVNENELDTLRVDRSTYLKYKIDEEYYRNEYGD